MKTQQRRPKKSKLAEPYAVKCVGCGVRLKAMKGASPEELLKVHSWELSSGIRPGGF